MAESRKTTCVESDVKMCPFLRNIVKPTDFSFVSGAGTGSTCAGGAQGPIFEDESNFDSAFNLFHGKSGVVPLTKYGIESCPFASMHGSNSAEKEQFASFASETATISLSMFGPAGPFGFDPSNSFRSQNNKPPSQKPSDSQDHEAIASEWLATGNCPIAKTFRAASVALPLVTKALTNPNVKLRCPAAVVAARAALAKTAPVKALRPQAIPVKLFAVGALGLGLNVPLGIWREHCEKFSPQWIIAVHAAVPLIAMLRKAVVMPKYAIAFTFASCIIGQAIGAKFEKKRLKKLKSAEGTSSVKGLPPLTRRTKQHNSTLVNSACDFSTNTSTVNELSAIETADSDRNSVIVY